MHQFCHTKKIGDGEIVVSLRSVALAKTLHPRFFQNLKIVAVDELHYYTGAFGT